MDCNKDEALRAKEIAVKKFLEKDVISAKKFALKAQKLYPELEGISHLVANFELHMSAKFRRNGEIDWYRMLGVSPFADAETISKHYRKMALTVHPDKNREMGSESAFKLLSEAFRVLKDSTLRSAYDKRVNIQPVQKNVSSQSRFVPVAPFVPNQTGYPAPQSWTQSQQSVQTQTKPRQSIPTRSGFSSVPPHGTNFRQNSQPKGRGSVAPRNDLGNSKRSATATCPINDTSRRKGPTKGGRSGAQPRTVDNGRCSDKMVEKSGYERGSSTAIHISLEKSSFWTRCSGCNMQFEYLLMFLNQHMSCPSCETAFQAMKLPTPSIWLNVDKHFSFSHQQNENPSQKAGFSHIKGFSASGAHQAAGVGELSNKGVKRGHDEAKGSSEIKRQKS